MLNHDSKELQNLISAFKSADETVKTALLNTNADSIDELKMKINKKLDSVSVSLMKKSRQWAKDDLPAAYKEGTAKVNGKQSRSLNAKASDVETGYIQLARNVHSAVEDKKDLILDAIAKAEKQDEAGATVGRVRNIIEEELKKDNPEMVVKYANGAKMPLSSYAEMLARTSRIESSNTGAFDRCKQLGIDLVYCPPVPNCCPYCKKFEDKVYSISGNDKRFPALYETALQRGYNIMHPNCRHEFLQWHESYAKSPEELQEIIDKSNRFEDFDKNEKLFKIYNQGQAFLRQLNSEKRAYDEMVNYYQAVGRKPPYDSLGSFRRSYRKERGSVPYNKTHRWKVGEKEILNAPPEEYNHDIIDSQDYIKKFSGIGNKQVVKTLRRESLKSIRRCDKTTDERGVILSENGEVFHTFYGKNSSADYSNFSFEKQKPNSLILTHNHPHSNSFSVDDILTATQYPAIKTIVATGHDGTVYSLSIGNGKRVDRSIEREYNTYMRMLNYDSHKTMTALSIEYGWRYSKR